MWLPLGAPPAAAFVGGVGSGFTIVAYLTYRAAATPDRLLGRVGSTARTISIGLQPIGLFATGILLDAIGGNLTVVLTGVGLLLAIPGSSRYRRRSAPPGSTSIRSRGPYPPDSADRPANRHPGGRPAVQTARRIRRWSAAMSTIVGAIVSRMPAART